MIVSGRSQERKRSCHTRWNIANALWRTEVPCRTASSRSPKQFSEMSKYTAFRCPEDLLELAKVKAKRDRRSLSNYIITLIEKDVQDMLPESEERVPAGQKRN